MGQKISVDLDDDDVALELAKAAECRRVDPVVRRELDDIVADFQSAVLRKYGHCTNCEQRSENEGPQHR